MKKKTLTLVCAFSVFFGNGSAVFAEEEEQKIDQTINVLPGAWIAVESKSKDGEFWKLVQSGMSDAVSDLNSLYGFSRSDKITMTFEALSSEMDVESQVNVLDAIIAENPEVLCLSASDMDSCYAQLEAASENGIPVVIFDSTVTNEELISAYRGTDNVEMGVIAGEMLADALAGEGKIAVFSAQEKTSSVIDRISGFQSVVEDTEIEIMTIIYQDQVENMEAAIRETLEAYPDLDGIYCTNADSTDLYLSLEIELRAGMVLVGTDATTAQQKAIRNGEQLGSVSQDPYGMGYETILAAAALTAPPGSENQVEKTVFLEPRWIDIENIDLEENAAYLY